MKRAAELFRFEGRSSCSPFIEETWQTRSEPEQFFMSVAVSRWEMVVTRERGGARLTVRGPETKATKAPIPQDAEFFGIQFSLATFMPGLPPSRLVDRSLTLPQATSTSFWLGGSTWELPGPDNADVFVDRLARAGLLVHDPVASAALEGDVNGLSKRSVERRVSLATGLTRGVIRQIRRAERAVELLSQGVSALDVACQAGYADQAHLTRSLKRFVGQTPSQIATSAARAGSTMATDRSHAARSRPPGGSFYGTVGRKP
ncbi:MAG: helix-turn-helix domain-containing protein [Acidimicrobiales bacterium]